MEHIIILLHLFNLSSLENIWAYGHIDSIDHVVIWADSLRLEDLMFPICESSHESEQITQAPSLPVKPSVLIHGLGVKPTVHQLINIHLLQSFHHPQLCQQPYQFALATFTQAGEWRAWVVFAEG